MDILQRLLIAENIKYSVTKYSSDINPFTEVCYRKRDLVKN